MALYALSKVIIVAMSSQRVPKGKLVVCGQIVSFYQLWMP